MIFLKVKPEEPDIGSTKTVVSLCILPLTFEVRTYWFHRVKITKTWTKDYIVISLTGEGWFEDGWKTTSVVPLT